MAATSARSASTRVTRRRRACRELRTGVDLTVYICILPQVYVDKEFLGGSDILMAMHQSGELAEVFGVEPPKAE